VTAPIVDLPGEHVAVPERMIVAPAVGVFRALGADAGTQLAVGDIVGVVEGPGTRQPVRSPFAGVVMGVLAHEGERLRLGQPIAWMRVSCGRSEAMEGEAREPSPSCGRTEAMEGEAREPSKP